MSSNRNSRRKEMWVSHNRVLVGGNKKNVRNPNFDTDETKLLISLWGNPSIQKTLITSHKKFPIITKLSEAMRQYGYHRTPEEINTRLKNLKCLYNRLKKDVEFGIRSHPTWKHYSAMDAILTRPIFGYQSNGEAQDENSLQGEDPTSLLLKEEDEELDEEDGLRPEDLLQVETTPEENVLTVEDDVVIKDEPIDVDEYEKKSSTEKMQKNPSEAKNFNIEKLPRLIPRSSWLNNSANGSREQAPPLLRSGGAIKTDTRQNSVICVNSPRTLSTVTSTTSSTNTSPTQQQQTATQSKGKISLVPTNLLLNQQKTQAAAAATANATGKNFFVANSNIPAITTTTSGSQSISPGEHNSTMPMKVLLVNTVPKSQPATVPGPVTNKAEIIPIPMNATRPRPVSYLPGKSSTATSDTLRESQRPVRRRPIIRRGSTTSVPPRRQILAVPGLKSLIANLVETQRETNALNRQRLELDTQQFNYQRRIIDEFLGLIPILKGIGTQFLFSSANGNDQLMQQQQLQHQHQQTQQPSSTLQCNGHEETIGDEEEDEGDEVVVGPEELESDT